jgi:hypothetical protein
MFGTLTETGVVRKGKKRLYHWRSQPEAFFQVLRLATSVCHIRLVGSTIAWVGMAETPSLPFEVGSRNRRHQNDVVAAPDFEH